MASDVKMGLASSLVSLQVTFAVIEEGYYVVELGFKREELGHLCFLEADHLKIDVNDR